MKTKEELNALKEEVETMNKKLAELSEDELAQVNGGMNSANDPNSIREWFERHGVDGSYQSRERIYRDMGYSNYTGTARQDQQMLNYLKSRYGY